MLTPPHRISPPALLHRLPTSTPIVRTLICFLFLGVFSRLLAANPEQVNVLVLNSYHVGYKWSDAELLGFSRLMGDEASEIICSYEHLDWQKYPDPAREAPFLASLLVKYRGSNGPNLIVTFDDPALDFILKNRSAFGGDTTPIVFGGINRLDPTLRERYPNLTGLGEAINIEQNFALIHRLHPDLRTLYAVHDQTGSSLLNRRIAEALADKYADKFHVEYLTDWTEESLFARLGNLPPNSAVLNLGLTLDRNGRIISGNVEFLAKLKKNTNAPLYRLNLPLTTSTAKSDIEALEWGALGGHMSSGIQHGQEIALTALRVLRGTRADQIPIETASPGTIMLDYRELNRFGIPLGRVPVDAQLFFQPLHAFTLSRSQVYGGLAILAATALAATYLFFNNIARRRAEAALRRFAAAIEQGRELIVFLDTDGKITYANPAFARLTGFPPAETIGKPFDFCLSDQTHRPGFTQLREECARHGVWTGRLDYFTSQRTQLHHEVLLTPLRDPKNLIIGYLQVGRDTTREDKLEEQVRLSQKMESIGLLAGGVAHDFNNLLQVILGCTQEALDEKTSPTERQEALKLTLASSQRAAELTRQLLLFGRRQHIEATDIHFGHLCQDLLKLLKRLIGEHITIEHALTPDLGNVRGDRGQIEQVLMNLCLNARDAMPSGGTLRIELSNIHFDSVFCASHPWAKLGDFVQLIVSDTGTGMEKAIADRIFDPFFSTKTKNKGTGLGLSVVYGIIQSHHGLIQVYSEPGVGTAMKTYWPIQPRQNASAPPFTPALTGGTHKGTLLLAEDEEAVRTYATKLLTRAGYRVIEARDGQQAVELFTEHQNEIHIVILDAVMPRMSGSEAKRRIRQIRPDAPILFCSGYSMEVLQNDIARPCDLGLLPKPYQGHELLDRLQRALTGGKTASS